MLKYMIARLDNAEAIKNQDYYKHSSADMKRTVDKIIQNQKNSKMIKHETKIPKEDLPMILRMFDWNPRKRPSCRDILQQRFEEFMR